MDEIIDLPDDRYALVKRPLAITLVCLINWLAGLFASSVFVYACYIRNITPKFAGVFSYALLCTALCVALWLMKRWAAVTYILLCIGVGIIMLLNKTWVDAAVIPIASVLVIAWYVRRFKALRPNGF
jgi:hypothetical protein